jgi:hypothetical protein
MTESTTTALPAEELRLAQLACAKLAGMLQGAISVGLSALVTGVPEPLTFLEERFRVMAGFAVVLNAVSGKPGAQQVVFQLRDRAREISDGLDDLRHRLMELVEQPPPAYRPARDSASALCDALADYGDLLGFDRSGIERVTRVIAETFEAVDMARNDAKASYLDETP